ncbi:MAG: CehA/McbA family metallohydrolase [Anaerolineae bacterium]|nr:CehA/McbA family metallohydrolase [Anaerolineae bacterium]
MDKFTPFNLSAFFNASRDNAPLMPGGAPPWQPEVAEALATMPGDAQTFWGIPFLLGPAEGGTPCWAILGASASPLTIPLSGQATYLVCAHFANNPPAPKDREGEVAYYPQNPGEHLADYVLVYADGSEYRQPVRSRFEINQAMARNLPFAARPDSGPEAVDWRGPFQPHGPGVWGRYQTGVRSLPSPSPAHYTIYALPNPHPQKALRALRIEPTGRDRFALAGLTLFHGQENPLRRERLQSLRVTLAEGEETTLEAAPVSVDLGTVVRTFTVPPFEPDAWLKAGLQGWGEKSKAAGDPAQPVSQFLTEVTASSDATLQVAGHEVNMGQVLARGEATSSDGKARVEVLTPHKAWVHVTVEDAATGRPTPVRIHFRSPDGRYLPPYGHRREVNDYWFEDYGADTKLGDTEYAYVDGRCQVELPVGEVYVEIAKGFEYRPVRQRLTVAPGTRELRLQIERPFNWRREGWVTADTHVHFLSPDTAWLEAQSEGVNLVNLLASQWGELHTNVGDIRGMAAGASRDDTLVWVGTENRQHLMGHISLLGVKGEPVFPMCAAGPGESTFGDPLWRAIADWADECRAKEGVVVYPHFPNPYCEVVADIILGKIDGVEIRDFGRATLDTMAVTEWYRFLNLGYRVAAVGGTDKMMSSMPLGGVRTYAHLSRDEAFTFENWARAVRAGRTFSSSGPLLTLTVDGHVPGDEIRLPAGGGTLEVEAHAQSAQPFDELQLVVNGKVVAQEAKANTRDLRLRTKVRMEGSGWLAARCWGAGIAWHVWPVHLAAHTSPVYIVAGGQEVYNPSDATYMMTMLEGGLTWVDTLAIPADPERQRRIRQLFLDAQARLGAQGHTHSH